MFGFLKKKLKDAIGSFSRKAEEEVTEEAVTDAQAIDEATAEEQELAELTEPAIEDIPSTAPEEPTERPEPKVDTPQRVAPAAAPKPESAPEAPPATSTAPEATVAEPPKAAERPKRGFLSRVRESFTKRTLSAERFEELFWDLEVAMLESNVALEVIEKIKGDLRDELTQGKVSRLGLQDQILLQLRKSIDEILSVPTYNLAHTIQQRTERPYVIMFLGVNGGGKTTSLAKLANKLHNHELSVVIAAADTFRAAAIDQLEEHAHALGVKMISQGYHADPAAVAFDAVQHAKAKGVDVVLIDTAGRLHSNKNLMAELQKVARVAKPDLRLFVGESTTGNDCVEQAKAFDEIIGIDAIILSKADVDEKGGAALSVSYVTKKPILYLGTGQSYGDLKTFDKHEIMKKLGF